MSDWHGRIVPLQQETGQVGGAAFLKTYFDAARAENPNTLTFMAGDSVGATPPISSFFGDEPAIRTMNMMGVNADTFGDHNFDGGIEHLQSLINIAEFPFVVALLFTSKPRMPLWVRITTTCAPALRAWRRPCWPQRSSWRSVSCPARPG